MIKHKLDSRTVDDILAEIKRKSALYTPEWRFDPKDPDGGAALARLFAEMFFGTIDRFNRYPDKCYIEFLNMLGVCAKSVSPAVGLARADLVEGAPGSVFIKKGTRLFTDVTGGEDRDDTRVVFETAAGFYAVPSKLSAIFMTDPQRDMITRTDPSGENAFPMALFKPNASQNLQRHYFALAHSNVLNLRSSAEIRVRLSNNARSFENDVILSRLCDASFAKWSYLSENGKFPLVSQLRQDHIALFKEDHTQIIPSDQNGAAEGGELLTWIFCEMTNSQQAEEIVVDEIAVSSTGTDDETHHGIIPDSVFFNDTELDAESPGYCFGSEPNPYDSFYIACSEALGKHGAAITAEFTMKTVIVRNFTASDNEPEFNQKLLVDKDEAKAAPPDDIYISEVIWEYWNGFGWARLDVRGDINPFYSQDQDEGKRYIRFVCPDDISVSMQNAHDDYWIRARVRSVENRFSLRGRWLLPLMKSASLRFDYGTDFLPAERVFTSNSLTDRMYDTGSTKTPMTLFSPMPQQHHAIYFMFDKPPEGFPVNLYFDFLGSTDSERILMFEHLTGEADGRTGWSELKVNDRTSGFSRSGVISMFCPKDFAKSELFGESGYWIRVINRSMDFGKTAPLPKLADIVMNTVDIIQRQTVRDEQHEVYAGTPYQSFRLLGKPVISCELWINEINEITLSEINSLKAENESAVRMVYAPDGALEEAWIRWEPRESLLGAGSERVYELDCSTGQISFGNGVDGRIPAYISTAEVSCDYTYGGGALGNLPAGALDGLIVGIPFVQNMTNHCPTCGGSDGQTMETIRKIGTARLLHRGRAVTVRDFESLVLEEFTEVREVCCFADRNARDIHEDGCVTVVVMPYDYADSVYGTALCRRIYDFLAERAAIGLCAANRLSVIPANVMRISSQITISLDDYEYAAEVEQNAEEALRGLLNGGEGARIGMLPRGADIITALRKIKHISHVSSVLLMGEYYRDGEKITVPLDDRADFKYFVSASGSHTIKI